MRILNIVSPFRDPQTMGFEQDLAMGDTNWRLELVASQFEPPVGVTHSQVLLEAPRLRGAEGGFNIQDSHLGDAIERLTRRTQESLSEDREARHAYVQEGAGP